MPAEHRDPNLPRTPWWEIPILAGVAFLVTLGVVLASQSSGFWRGMEPAAVPSVSASAAPFPVPSASIPVPVPLPVDPSPAGWETLVAGLLAGSSMEGAEVVSLPGLATTLDQGQFNVPARDTTTLLANLAALGWKPTPNPAVSANCPMVLLTDSFDRVTCLYTKKKTAILVTMQPWSADVNVHLVPARMLNVTISPSPSVSPSVTPSPTVTSSPSVDSSIEPSAIPSPESTSLIPEVTIQPSEPTVTPPA